MFSLFRKKTVDGVLAVFAKAVEDLRAIDAECTAEIAKIDDKTAALMGERLLVAKERTRANGIADKIASLIS